VGERAAETVEEIQELRHRLDGEVRELERRLPAPARWTKQLAGIAAGGGLGGYGGGLPAKRWLLELEASRSAA
jgi:hypothetical protein